MTADIWALIRVFEKDFNKIWDRFKKTQTLIENLINLNITNIQILIPKNEDKIWFFHLFREKFEKNEKFKKTSIQIYEVDWNHFTDLLNYWIKNNILNWVKYSLIISPEVWHLLNRELISTLLSFLNTKEVCAASIIVNFNKFNYNSKEKNKIQLFSNTCCIWKTKLLDEVWLFWEEWKYWVEEIWPTIKLIQKGYKIKLKQINQKKEYIHVPGSEQYQSFKIQSKLIRQINSYLLFLKINSKISDDSFDNSYCSQNYNIFKPPLNLKLRKEYENRLIEITNQWIYIE